MVKETCSEFQVSWKPTKNFIFERLPELVRFYLFSSVRSGQKKIPFLKMEGWKHFFIETFSYSTLKNSFVFIYYGFRGVGSI